MREEFIPPLQHSLLSTDLVFTHGPGVKDCFQFYYYLHQNILFSKQTELFNYHIKMSEIVTFHGLLL